MIVQTLPENKIEVRIKLSDAKIEKIKEICDSFDNDPGELINVLHETQMTYGYLPAEVQELIAKNLGVSSAHVYGVVTFYSFFTMVPKGKHPISICLGTACYVKGAGEIYEKIKKTLDVEDGGTTPDGKFSLDACRCMGACGLAPVLSINDDVYGKVTPDQIAGILKRCE